MSKYSLRFSRRFERDYPKLIQKNPMLSRKIENTLELLRSDPYSFPLLTHKVNSRKYGMAFSSRVTGDIRILWRIDEGFKQVIAVIAIGGHEGKRSVY